MATVYLPLPSATEQAVSELGIRRKNVMSMLQEQGASAEMQSVVSSALATIDHASAAAVLLVAGADEVLLNEPLDRPVSRTVVRVGPTPALLPLLSARQTDAPHLAILIDRAGADVMWRNGVGDPLESFEVEGGDPPLHRGHFSGWSQRRFQQTAENSWENNAKDVVDEISQRHPEAEFVIVGGDVRAVGFFVDHVPAKWNPIHVVDGARHGDHDAFLDEADLILRTRAASRLASDLDDFRSGLASGHAVTGNAVFEMLEQRRIERLLVANDSGYTKRLTARFDFDAGRRDPKGVHAPVTEAAVALAVGGGAGVIVTPRNIGELDKGIGGQVRGTTSW